MTTASPGSRSQRYVTTQSRHASLCCSSQQAQSITSGAGAASSDDVGVTMGPPGDGYDRHVSSPRYRCTACGNLTRFDVTSTRRTKAFHHYTVGGELSVEEVEVLDDDIEAVTCRWCGPAAKVEELAADTPA